MHNYFIALEVVISLGVIFRQLYHFTRTRHQVRLFRQLLPEKELDEQYILRSEINHQSVSVIKGDNALFSEAMIRTINSINKYLQKNHGTADFSIIKNIVDRNVLAKEHEVSATISLPLYTGLMGTFIGVILGLFKIAFFGGVTDENINAFLAGIFIAMIASLMGLYLTVQNSSVNFKEAKKETDRRKNQFFDFLQIYLLPHLGNSLHEALDRLKDNINEFNDKFGRNVQLFDTNFSSNIWHLKNSVESIADNINPILENTKIQKEFLAKLQGIGYARVADANLKVFTILQESGPNFVQFINKQKELNESIERTAQFVRTIEHIMNRVQTFEESINNLGDRINTTEYLQSDLLHKVNKKLSHLDQQFEALKQHSQKTNEEIYDFFQKEYREVAALTGNIRREVERALDFNIDHNPLQKLLLLDKLVELDRLQALDKLQALEKLNELDKLVELGRLQQLEQLSEGAGVQVGKIAGDLTASKESLQAIQEQLAALKQEAHDQREKLGEDVSVSTGSLRIIAEQLSTLEEGLKDSVLELGHEEHHASPWWRKMMGKNGKQ